MKRRSFLHAAGDGLVAATFPGFDMTVMAVTPARPLRPPTLGGTRFMGLRSISTP